MIRLSTGKLLPYLLGLVVTWPWVGSASEEDLGRWWADLASTDGARAYRAVGQLASVPQRAVPILSEHLRPVAAVPHRRVSQLIAELDSEQYPVREKAQRELEKLQDLAEEELRQALDGGPTLEVRRRVERLLEQLDLLRSPERLRALRAIEVLEQIGNPEARQVLQRLASGAPEAQQTREAKASLERLARRSAPRP
jgi:hypothetical protein